MARKRTKKRTRHKAIKKWLSDTPTLTIENLKTIFVVFVCNGSFFNKKKRSFVYNFRAMFLRLKFDKPIDKTKSTVLSVGGRGYSGKSTVVVGHGTLVA